MTENSIELDTHTLHVQRLFVQHQQAVLSYVLSIEPDLHDAQEIVQETFMTASRKASSWTAGTNFLAWTCAMARFNSLHLQRTRGRRNRRLAKDVVEMLAQQTENDLDDFQDRVSAVRDCLRELAPRAEELVKLRYHGGMLPEAIAEEIGWKANSVRVALTRARNSLRDCLHRSEKAGCR